jgi:hypothetical protein
MAADFRVNLVAGEKSTPNAAAIFQWIYAAATDVTTLD